MKNSDFDSLFPYGKRACMLSGDDFKGSTVIIKNSDATNDYGTIIYDNKDDGSSTSIGIDDYSCFFTKTNASGKKTFQQPLVTLDQLTALTNPTYINTTLLKGGTLNVYKIGRIVIGVYFNGHTNTFSQGITYDIATGLPKPIFSMYVNGDLHYGNTIYPSHFIVNDSGYLQVISPVTGEFGMTTSFVYVSAS